MINQVAEIDGSATKISECQSPEVKNKMTPLRGNADPAASKTFDNYAVKKEEDVREDREDMNV